MLTLNIPSLKYGDFSGSIFRGMTFYITAEGTDFTNADLTGVTFAVDTVVNANFTGANLTGATLNYRNLTGATFTDANLTGAKFTDANLTGATFTDANISGVTWVGATCPDGTVLTTSPSDTCVGHLTAG